MNHQIIFTKEAPEPIGPYSQAVKVGNLIFCSGQIPIDPKTNQVFLGDVAQQTHMVLKNIQGVLKSVEADLSNVIKVNIFLNDMAHFAKVNEVYCQYFTNNFPARSTVAVRELPKGVSVEIEVVGAV